MSLVALIIVILNCLYIIPYNLLSLEIGIIRGNILPWIFVSCGFMQQILHVGLGH